MKDGNVDLHSLEAEQALLGGLLVANAGFHSVSDLVAPEAFYDPLHRTIATKLWDTLNKGHGVTPFTLATTFPDRQAEILPGLTVQAFLARLVAEAISVQHLPDYARVVANFSVRRKMIASLQDSIAMISKAGTDEDALGLLDQVDAPLFDIRDSVKGPRYRWLWQAADEALEESEEAMNGNKAGFTFGVPRIDSMVGVVARGHVMAIAAPSGAGKTALATQFMLNCPARSLMIQMEMTGMDVAQRVMAHRGAPSVKVQRSGRFNDGEFARVEAQAQAMKTVPIIIDDTGRHTMRSIRSRIRQMRYRHGIEMVVIDNMQLLADDFPGQHEMAKIADAAKQLKDIAKENDVVLVMLSQLTRGSQKEARSWRFTDQAIYGGDVLKQASDIVIGVASPADFIQSQIDNLDTDDEQRRAAKLTEKGKWLGHVEIGALKMRDDEKGRWIKVAFDGATARFADPD